MTRKDKLRENYEDALFALLMESVMEEEGEQLLQESSRLNADPAFEVPEEVHQRCRRTIKRAFARKNRMSAGKKLYRILSHAATVIVACGLLFTVAYAAIPEVRVGTLNLLLEVEKNSTTVRFEGIDDENLVPLADYRYPPVPEGFYLAPQYSSVGKSLVKLYFVNDSDDFIAYITRKASNASKLVINTENTEHGEIEINGRPGYIATGEDLTDVIVMDEARGTICSVICRGEVSDLALELASGILFPEDINP